MTHTTKYDPDEKVWQIIFQFGEDRFRIITTCKEFDEALDVVNKLNGGPGT